MADFDKIDLTKAMWMIIAILGAYGAYKVISFVYLLIIGATAEVAVSGAIAVPAVLFTQDTNLSVSPNGTIIDVLNSVETGFTSFVTAELVVIGLISLVVIIQVFWPLISQYIPKGNQGKGMN